MMKIRKVVICGETQIYAAPPLFCRFCEVTLTGHIGPSKTPIAAIRVWNRIYCFWRFHFYVVCLFPMHFG